MERESIIEAIGETIAKATGIDRVRRLAKDDYAVILEKERDAEERSLMGLGKVVNTGVRKILEYDVVFVALTTMEFDWGPYSTLLLKKEDVVVGEEVKDEQTIRELSKDKNVWFLHKNFVVYKNKISFPQDIMKKACYFEIPCLAADFCVLDQDRCQCGPIVYCNPSGLSDVYLKEKYFEGLDERGLGTILVAADVK